MSLTYANLLHVNSKSRRRVLMWYQHGCCSPELHRILFVSSVYPPSSVFFPSSCLLCSVLQVWPGCDRQLPAVAWFHTLAVPPPSADYSLGNHRPPGWRQPVRLRAGQPAQSIPLHFLSICSGLFINNYCLAELQCARWLGQGERLCDLSPPLG